MTKREREFERKVKKELEQIVDDYLNYVIPDSAWNVGITKKEIRTLRDELHQTLKNFAEEMYEA